jgi:hypothetical protein
MPLTQVIQKIVIGIFFPILALSIAEWISARQKLNLKESNCIKLGMILGAILTVGLFLLTKVL